jgi:hypothetical protein
VSGLLYPKSIKELAHQKVNMDGIDAKDSGLSLSNETFKKLRTFSNERLIFFASKFVCSFDVVSEKQDTIN